MTIANSNIAFIDRIVYNEGSWFNVPNKPLSVGYRTDLLTWAHDGTITSNVTAPNLKTADNTIIQKAMTYWSNVAKVTFSVSPTPQAVFRIADSISYPNSGTPYGLDTRDPFTGTFRYHDVIYDKDYFSSQEGSKGFLTVMHEIGHVLGLDDVFYSGGYNQSHTIMTPDESFGGTPSRPMMYDIAAAQYLYGANTTYNATSTTYSADTQVAANKITGEAKLWTVWDAGGTDTFDFSKVTAAETGAKIDLRGGTDLSGKVNLTEVGQERIAIALDPASNWEKAIIIEHAKGNKGNDTIYGNDGNNSLSGGLGNDLIVAGKGQDTVLGQDGDDTLSDSWWETIDYTGLSNSKDTLNGGAGNDWLTSYDGTDVLTGGTGFDDIWFMHGSNGGSTVTDAAYTGSDYVFSYGTGTKVTSNNPFDRVVVFENTATITLNITNPYHEALLANTRGDANWDDRGVIMINPTAHVTIVGGDINSRLVIGNMLLEGKAKHANPQQFGFIDNMFIHNEMPISDSDAVRLCDPENILGAGYKVVAEGGSDAWVDLFEGRSATIGIWNGGFKVATIQNWYEGDFGLLLDYGQHLYFAQYTPPADMFGAAPIAFNGETYLQSLAEATAVPQPTLNTVTGGAANDTLNGGNTADIISGLGGNDIISSAGGNDTIDGGAGRDTLTGGADNDMFLFSNLAHSQRTGTGADLIKDFANGRDKVDLSAFAFTAFDIDGGSTEAGELRIFYQSSTNDTMVFSDQTGFAFRLSGNVVSTFGNADIVF